MDEKRSSQAVIRFRHGYAQHPTGGGMKERSPHFYHTDGTQEDSLMSADSRTVQWYNSSQMEYLAVSILEQARARAGFGDSEPRGLTS